MGSCPGEWDDTVLQQFHQMRARNIEDICSFLGCEFRMGWNNRNRITLGHLHKQVA